MIEIKLNDNKWFWWENDWNYNIKNKNYNDWNYEMRN